MNYERHETVSFRAEDILDVKNIIQDKEQKDWTKQEIQELVKLLHIQDYGYDWKDIDDIEELKANCVREICYRVGNTINSGDWSDYNGESIDNSWNLQNICNVAFNLIENWVGREDLSKKELKELHENFKTFEKVTSLEYEIYSDKLIELIRELEN